MVLYPAARVKRLIGRAIGNRPTDGLMGLTIQLLKLLHIIAGRDAALTHCTGKTFDHNHKYQQLLIV